MPATIYKCPMCGNDIEVSDTSLSYDELHLDRNIIRVRIDTMIKHTGVPEPMCGEFLQLLAKEHRDIITKWVEASQKKQGV